MKNGSPQDYAFWIWPAESRVRLHDIWNSAKEGNIAQLNAEEQQLAKIMREHDEYHNQFEIADVLADHEFDPERDVNPFLHVTIHSIIENQLSSKDPIEAYQFYMAISRRGADHHETVHIMLAIFVPLLFDAMKHNRAFDEKFYTFLLRKLKDKKPEKIENGLEQEFARYFGEDEGDEGPVKNHRLDPKMEETIDQALEMAENGHLKAAEKIIMKLLRKHPGIFLVQFAAGVMFVLKGRYQEAISHFDRAIALNPDFVEAWYNKGAAHQQLLDIEQSIMAYQKVMEIGDTTDDFVMRAASFIDKFEQSLRKDGMSVADYLKGGEKFLEAFAAMEDGNWEEALGGFKEVLSLNPRHVQSYGNMGICCGFLGRKEEALAAFNKALEIDPGYEPARMNQELTLSLKEGEKLNTKMLSMDYYKHRMHRDRENRAPDAE